MSINCPICNSATKLKEKISKEKIKDNLEYYFQTTINEEIGLIDYDILKCSNCSYYFSYPFKEGTNKFYNWITHQNTYYPSTRWEYGQVLNLIKHTKINDLLDVGCGDGEFLNFVKQNSELNNLYGIDPTKSSIDNCQKRGLDNTFCETIDEFLNSKDIKFDLVTSFHVLEHISDPINFVCGLKKLIKNDGRIIISTPYSPMDFEYFWFDILNKPPHHMGFWNEISYQKLADVLDMNIKIMMPPSARLRGSLINSLKLWVYGPGNKNNVNPYFLLISNPFKVLRVFIKLLFRNKINGERAANVITVLLTNKL